MKEKYLLNKNKREYILARVSQLNYFILDNVKFGNIDKAKLIEQERNVYCEKYIKDFNKINNYIMTLNERRRALYTGIKNNVFKDKEKKIKEAKKIDRIINAKATKDLYDFIYSFYATVLSVNNGRVVKLEDMPKEIKNEISYEFAKDVYFNLFPQNNVGEDLAYLYMRSRLVKYDMPMFMSKDLKQEFNNFIMARTGHNILEHDFLSEMPELRTVYTNIGNVEMEKQLYESVFPEFGFKYEDREQETTTVYTMDWKDKYM